MAMRALTLLLLARAANALADEDMTGNSIPPEVATARSDLARETAELVLEQKAQLRGLKDKHFSELLAWIHETIHRETVHEASPSRTVAKARRSCLRDRLGSRRGAGWVHKRSCMLPTACPCRQMPQ